MPCNDGAGRIAIADRSANQVNGYLRKMSEFPTSHECGEATGALLGDAVKGFCWGVGFATGFFMVAKLFHFT